MSKRRLIIIAAVVLALGAGFFFFKRSSAPEVVYKEVAVGRNSLAVQILSTGVVQPENRLEIKPPVAGRAEQVLVDEGARVRRGDVLVWVSSTERAALLDAARARGPEEMKSWEAYYKATPVLAPINGMVIQRNIQPGQTFSTADAIMVMSDRLTVQAQVDETDIAQIKLKQRAQITLDAYAKDKISGQVDKIAYDAKTVNNVTTYIVHVLPDKTPTFMRSGMTASVNFDIDQKDDALTAPTEAVKRKPDGSGYVLIKNPNDPAKTAEQAVETGMSDGKNTEIVSGLTEGQIIVMPQIKSGGKASATSPFSPMGSGPRRPRGGS